ncbi:hypothetical protein [Devosia beringensis]|uniref:hypothetical protein n=1 Tax=Devosia beringensis TaxID=2657486 RepID=UPI00186B9D7A|nr:hypothetical protein [Devosia beringensis]
MKPRLSGKEILQAIHDGNDARAEKAHALATELPKKKKITRDDIRAIGMLDHQLTPFLETIRRTELEVRIGKCIERLRPLGAAATAFCISVTIAVVCLMVAAAGGML